MFNVVTYSLRSVLTFVRYGHLQQPLSDVTQLIQVTAFLLHHLEEVHTVLQHTDITYITHRWSITLRKYTPSYSTQTSHTSHTGVASPRGSTHRPTAHRHHIHHTQVEHHLEEVHTVLQHTDITHRWSITLRKYTPSYSTHTSHTSHTGGASP